MKKLPGKGSKVVAPTVLPAGPYATHFQEYTNDPFFCGKVTERDSYSQRPRVNLADFLANRFTRALTAVELEDEEG